MESYFYLLFKSKGIKFKHNLKYKDKGFGKRRYDFYFIKENKYIEVTSYTKHYERWKLYYKKILEKKKYVETVLGAKFEFIQKILTLKERMFVRQNIKTKDNPIIKKK